MKRRKRTYIITVAAILIAVLAAFIGWGYLKLRQQQKNADVDLYAFVPAKSDAIIELQSLDVLDKTVRHSCFKQAYKELDASAMATFIIENIEQLAARKQPRGNANRLLISFHQPGTVHDQIVYGQTMGEDAEEYIRQTVSCFFPTSGAARSVAYREEKITIYPVGRNFLACWFKEGAFAVSMQKRLIESVIDAYKEGIHAMTHPTLASLRNQRKSRETITLYLNTNHENAWKEIDIRMNHEAIFLSENKAENDTVRHEMPTNGIENLNGENYLPGHLKMVYQTIFNKKSEEAPLLQLLHEQGCREVTYLMFSPKDSAHISHQLLVAPLPANNMNGARTTIRYGIGAKRLPSIRTNERAYPVWLYNSPKNGITQYFAQTVQDTTCYLALGEDNIFIANSHEALQDYIKETAYTTSGLHHDVNRKHYLRAVSKLDEDAPFTLMADVDDLMYHTAGSSLADNKLIPAFITKHPAFFRHFLYCRQAGQSNGITLLWQAEE